MKKLRIGIIDIVSRGPTRALYARIMNASLASIMPQVIGVWCKEEGHDVTFVCYTGFEDLLTELPDNVDVVFIGAFTEAAHTAYALSNLFRRRGAITVIGGPHARCYPEDAARYFDYVLGFTDKGDAARRLAGLLATPARRRPPRGLPAAQNPPGGSRALAVYRRDAQESAPPQDGSHARQPGVPVHLRVLYRCHGTLSTHGLRGTPRGPPVPADQIQTAPGSLARSQFWSPLRRLHGHDRGRRPSRQHRLRRRKQSVPAFRTAPQAAPTQFIQRRPSRH